MLWMYSISHLDPCDGIVFLTEYFTKKLVSFLLSYTDSVSEYQTVRSRVPGSEMTDKYKSVSAGDIDTSTRRYHTATVGDGTTTSPLRHR